MSRTPSIDSKIIVIGSSNTDMIVQAARIPRPGETLLGGRFSTAAGGKGANQAVAAARAGGQVAFVACVGRDNLGDQALADFRREGMEVKFIRRDATAPSGVALICVAATGENSIVVAPGANAALSPADIQRAGKTITADSVVLLQLEIPLATVKAAADLAARARAMLILNPAPAQKLPAGLLRKITLLTPNETEAELLTGIKVKSVANAEAAARRLLAQGVGTVVVTLGAKGALVVTREGRELVPGFKVKAVDTTAAGDVFNGALAVALSEGQVLTQAVRFANAAAALSVTRLGAQPSIPQRREIESRLV